MKTISGLLLLLFSLVCMSMTSCPKCIKGRLKIEDDAKKWLPYQGKDSLRFISSVGTVHKFRCSYADVTNTYQNFDCLDYFEADSVGFSLEVKQADSLFLNCTLSSPSWLSFRVSSRDSFYLSGGNVLNGPITEMRNSFPDYLLNNTLYRDVRLMNGYPGTNPKFDSLFFARNFGIVSFKYRDTVYYLMP